MKKVIVLLGIILIAGIWIVAQQSKADPITYKLNSEASKTYIDIMRAQDELRLKFAQLEVNRTALLIGAGVPVEARENCKQDKEVIVCSKPEPTPAKGN